MTNITSDTFSTIKNENLKTWNRCAQIWNLLADKGPKSMNEYIRQFSEADRLSISKMFSRIKTDGYEKTRSAINREVQENVS